MYMRIILTVCIPALSTEAFEGIKIHTNYFKGISSLLQQHSSSENSSLLSQNVKTDTFLSCLEGKKKNLCSAVRKAKEREAQAQVHFKTKQERALKKRLLLLLQIGHHLIITR